MTPVGVLGGSFDPVHRGHIELARHARASLGLERILLLPCADPPHKPERVLAARHHRLEMLYLATADREGISVSTFELARGGVRYTIDTLRGLRDGVPPLAPVFLCGSDALAEIASWRAYEELLSEFDFAAVIRPDDSGRPCGLGWPDAVLCRQASFNAKAGPALGAGGRVFRLDVPAVAVSSSLVRSRVGAGGDAGDLVPAHVARYIQRHRLYSEEAPR